MSVTLDRNKMPSDLDGTIGLCYFDPQEEVLKEFNPSVSIVLGPFEESVRRFYIVKPSNTIQGSIYNYVKVSVESSSPYYEVKVKIGEGSMSSVESYSQIEGKECSTFFSHYSNGLIPIDFYSKNTSITESEFNLELTLEVL